MDYKAQLPLLILLSSLATHVAHAADPVTLQGTGPVAELQQRHNSASISLIETGPSFVAPTAKDQAVTLTPQGVATNDPATINKLLSSGPDTITGNQNPDSQPNTVIGQSIASQTTYIQNGRLIADIPVNGSIHLNGTGQGIGSQTRPELTRRIDLPSLAVSAQSTAIDTSSEALQKRKALDAKRKAKFAERLKDRTERQGLRQ